MIKKLFLFSCLLALVTSCSPSLYPFYEICSVASNLPTDKQDNYVYSDEYCSISYNFWCEGGNPGFSFFNKTDEIIYIDLGKSFFVNNGIAYDYYLNRSYSNSVSNSISVSGSASATAYGLLAPIFNAYSPIIPGSVSASKSSNSSSSTSSAKTTEEKRIIAIPPHSSKVVTEYTITSELFYNCDQDITPKYGTSPVYNFEGLNSPVSFSNYIVYNVGESKNSIAVTNDFYISSIQFLAYDMVGKKIEEGCPNEKVQKNVFKDHSPKKFYIEYMRPYKPASIPRSKKSNESSLYNDDFYNND